MIFCEEQSPAIRESLRLRGVGRAMLPELGRELAALWRGLRAADRQRFQQLAAAERGQYLSELKAYEEATDPRKALKSKYAHLVPKRPPSAFQRFCRDPEQRRLAEASLIDAGIASCNVQSGMMSRLGEMWKLAPEEARRAFVEQATADFAEHEERMLAWRATPEYESFLQSDQEQRAAERAKRREPAADPAAFPPPKRRRRLRRKTTPQAAGYSDLIGCGPAAAALGRAGA